MPRVRQGGEGKHRVFWWNDNVADLRRECIKAKKILTISRKKEEAGRVETLEGEYAGLKKVLSKIQKSKEKVQSG